MCKHSRWVTMSFWSSKDRMPISAMHFLAFAFLVQRMRHNRNRRPYELRICDKWHSVQDEEHTLLDCPHEHLVSLRTQHRQLVSSHHNMKIAQLARLRTFLNQPLADSIYYIWRGLFCGWVPSPFPLIFSSAFLFWFQAFSKLPLRWPPEAYIAM